MIIISLLIADIAELNTKNQNSSVMNVTEKFYRHQELKKNGTKTKITSIIKMLLGTLYEQCQKNFAKTPTLLIETLVKTHVFHEFVRGVSSVLPVGVKTK